MKRPDLRYEKILWGKGVEYVMGTDEVGRGAFAGPVVAGACALIDKNCTEVLGLGIDDSKRLSEKRRKMLTSVIAKHFHFATGECDVNFINRFGIVPATERAIRQAVVRLLQKIIQAVKGVANTMIDTKDINALNTYLLLDAFNIKYLPVVGLKKQKAIVHGDRISVTIAAASIVAKVYRDDLMKELAKGFNRYGWERNSGYGTPEHIKALKQNGASCHHRTKFVDAFI